MPLLPIPGYANSLADYSACEDYRYSLNITLTNDPSILMFVMLNPSQACAENRDGTVTRCMNRAKNYHRDFGGHRFGKICVTNIFPLITQYPRTLKVAENKFDSENDDAGQIKNYETIQERAQDDNVTKIVCAWGANGSDRRLAEEVTRIKTMLHRVAADKLQWFRETASGEPKHPLGLAYAQNFEPWEF